MRRICEIRRMQTGKNSGMLHTLTSSVKNDGKHRTLRYQGGQSREADESCCYLPFRNLRIFAFRLVPNPGPFLPPLCRQLVSSRFTTSGLRRGAYAGLSASILRQMTYSLTRFGIYDELKKRLTKPGEATLPAWKMALAASVAGGIGGVAGNPADVVLVRMTADAAKPVEQRLGYKHW